MTNMSKIARNLRNKKASSTDPEWLEKMAEYYDTPMEPLDMWLFEQENLSLRYERLMAEIGNNPLAVIEWLKTAYELGFEYGRYKNVSDLRP